MVQNHFHQTSHTSIASLQNSLSESRTYSKKCARARAPRRRVMTPKTPTLTAHCEICLITFFFLFCRAQHFRTRRTKWCRSKKIWPTLKFQRYSARAQLYEIFWNFQQRCGRTIPIHVPNFSPIGKVWLLQFLTFFWSTRRCAPRACRIHKIGNDSHAPMSCAQFGTICITLHSIRRLLEACNGAQFSQKHVSGSKNR